MRGAKHHSSGNGSNTPPEDGGHWGAAADIIVSKTGTGPSENASYLGVELGVAHDVATVGVGPKSLVSRKVVSDSSSIGSEPVHGTFGIAGGVAHTNVGVHGGETKDASALAMHSIREGETAIEDVVNSDSLHWYSTPEENGGRTSSVKPYSKCGDLVVTKVWTDEST